MQVRLKLKDIKLVGNMDELAKIPQGKTLINTINAYSYTMTRHDALFADALMNGDYLIPDGASIVKACRFIKASSQPQIRIAGWDLFEFEMQRQEEESKKSMTARKVMFMGSSEKVLSLIRKKTAEVYPHLTIETYSPPYKPEFNDEDNRAIIKAINEASPNLLWIGMTAPKQEKWAYSHWDELMIDCHVGTIGAVFDFFAGTAMRAPQWWQANSLEWLFRLIKEPRRMWRRYIIGNIKFTYYMLQERWQ